ncbi:SDR family oxidoreductase [Paenibacillus sp. HW567]|uniref:SDR family oxidoreductase n=1 Tax=Paenibacillus sp. HW567 TaxID=1034769 RepID=UPI00036445C7|nr:SDR family oxidoreductase [Paenibacillus sp. HW567]
MSILVTGATGQLGALVVEKLLGTLQASELAVSVRSAGKAAELKAKGVDVREGDFTNSASLEQAFAGVERLLLISGTEGDRFQQHKNAIDTAKKAGVSQIVYTSLAQADNSTLSLAPDHKNTEDYLKESGVAFTILRNNWYLENEADGIKAAAQGAPFVHAASSAKVGWAARRDYAHAAAAVLTSEGHANKVYELSGKTITHDELGAIIADVIGKEVQVQNLTAAAYDERLQGFGLPEGVAAFVTGFQTAIGEGALDVQSEDLEKLLGRPQQPLSEVIAAILA